MMTRKRAKRTVQPTKATVLEAASMMQLEELKPCGNYMWYKSQSGNKYYVKHRDDKTVRRVECCVKRNFTEKKDIRGELLSYTQYGPTRMYHTGLTATLRPGDESMCYVCENMVRKCVGTQIKRLDNGKFQKCPIAWTNPSDSRRQCSGCQDNDVDTTYLQHKRQQHENVMRGNLSDVSSSEDENSSDKEFIDDDMESDYVYSPSTDESEYETDSEGSPANFIAKEPGSVIDALSDSDSDTDSEASPGKSAAKEPASVVDVVSDSDDEPEPKPASSDVSLFTDLYRFHGLADDANLHVAEFYLSTLFRTNKFEYKRLIDCLRENTARPTVMLPSLNHLKKVIEGEVHLP